MEIRLCTMPLPELPANWRESTEKEKIFSLGERLGYLGMDMQLRQLQLLEEDLENEIQELNKDLKEKKKLYQSLGILLGILLAVLVA